MRAALSALVLMAACAAQETPPAAGPPQTAEEATEADTCGTGRYTHLIGTQAEAIDRASLPPRTRVITPDMMVTMDFLAERLNVIVGTDGRVGSLRCF